MCIYDGFRPVLWLMGKKSHFDCMHERGVITCKWITYLQIKLSSVQLARKYMKRVATELDAMGEPEKEPNREFLILQGVRFAFRVHQVTFLRLCVIPSLSSSMRISIVFIPFFVPQKRLF